MYLPFRPIKGQALRVYFATTPEGTTQGTLDTSLASIGLSKDGAAFVATTNAVVNISFGISANFNGKFYVDLTASEMDSDIIILAGRGASSNAFFQTIIYTTAAELSSSPTLNSSVADKITAIYQYFFNKRAVTATALTLYKADGSTTLGTGTISDDSTTVTKGAVS